MCWKNDYGYRCEFTPTNAKARGGFNQTQLLHPRKGEKPTPPHRTARWVLHGPGAMKAYKLLILNGALPEQIVVEVE